MSVVLRCPTCGTTQGHSGECEACSEGEVRYFCTNHAEGIWLDDPMCGRCGATFGDAQRRPPTPATASVPTRPGGAADFRPPGHRRTPERRPEPDSSRPSPGRPERDERAEPEVLPGTPWIGELLEDISAEGSRADGAYEAGVPWEKPRPRRPWFALAGCLVRIVVLVMLLIAAVTFLLILLFGGALVD